MTAGRRRALLSAALLGSAAVFAGGPARGQDRSPHELWRQELTPDQIRAALARMGAGEAGLDPFGEMVKDYLRKNNPGLDPKQAEDVIKKLTGNKQLMDQLKQIAKQKQTDPGRPGKLDPAELGKLFEEKRQSGQLPKLPDDIKGFGPPPDPKVGPRPPKNERPIPNPNPGTKVEPKVEPNPDPVQNPPPQPVPAPDPKDKGPITLDPNPFGSPEESSDPRTKSLEAFASLWERNIGPLDETPELKRALFGLVGENGFDFDLTDDKGNSFWDLLKNGTADGSSFGDLFNGSGPGGGDWGLGSWEFPKLGNWFGSGGSSSGGSSSWWGSGSSNRPRPGSSSGSSGWGSGGWGSGGGGFGGAWLPFALLLLVVLGVFVWFKLKALREAAPVPAAAGGLGPWPVDPRAINTREDVVKAFEYLSVLVCGPAARNWTHGTIADALSDVAATHGETAVLLARLYELARYAPLDEPLTAAELVEARGLVCSLAGVSY